MAAHAKFSPSSMKRLLACPGSAILSGGSDGSNSSSYAAAGTLMHEISELLLLGRIEDPPELGSIHNVDGHDVVWELDMQEGVHEYVGYVVDVVTPESELHVEVRVHLAEDVWGTSDVIVWHPGKRHVDVIDLKGGKGVLVDADTDQLKVYGLASIQTLGLNPLTVSLHVVQPRARDEDGNVVRVSHFTLIDLLEYKEDVLLPGIERLRAGDRTLKAGDHCRFCPAKGVCPELHQEAVRVAKMEFGDDPPEVDGMSDADLAEALDQAELISSWLEGVRAEVSRRLDTGVEVPGWKLVQKRGSRRWINADEAEKALVALGADPADYTETTLLSAVQLSKRWPDIYARVEADHVTKASSGTTLVREADSRPAVLCGAKHEFAEDA